MFTQPNNTILIEGNYKVVSGSSRTDEYLGHLDLQNGKLSVWSPETGTILKALSPQEIQDFREVVMMGGRTLAQGEEKHEKRMRRLLECFNFMLWIDPDDLP